ncbi:MAG: hypothetical protein WCO69_02165 [Candidatus Omnitrophota bacterium]
MSNVTMSIDAALLRRARKVAVEKNTSVNALIREHLTELVSSEQAKGEAMARRFRASVRKFNISGWNKPVNRDEIYER